MAQKSSSWLLLIILSMVWGSSFILMKRGLDAFSSDEVAALRISIAFLFLSPLLLKYYKFDFRKHLRGLIFMGVFGNLIPAFLFTKAETHISSSLTGMLNALVPMFTILVGLVWLKVRPSPRQVTGVVVGFVAAAGLLLFESNEDTWQNFLFGGLVLIATLFYAISINGIRKYLRDVSPVIATIWAFTITGPVALVYLFGFSDFTTHWSHNPHALRSLGYVSILAIVGTALSVIFYNVLIRREGVIFASSCTYLIPVAAILWGLADGEMITAGQLLSILAIILSVYLINRD
jgi:drug/metabolite transporter (DMT)-like permease